MVSIFLMMSKSVPNGIVGLVSRLVKKIRNTVDNR